MEMAVGYYKRKQFSYKRIIIMKAVYLLCLCLLAVSCSTQQKETTTNNQQQIIQKDTIMAAEKFNIEEFNKHQKENAWRFTDDYGKEHYLRYIGGGYTEEISTKNNPLVLRCNYYSNGNLKRKGYYFHGNSFNKGIWIDYDEKGNIVKQTDYDEPYKNAPWEKIKAYMESKDIDLMDRLTSVSRHMEKKRPMWSISWSTKKINAYGGEVLMNEEIDGNTGEILLIYENCYFLDPPGGTPPCEKIIYDARKPEKPQSNEKKTLGTPYKSVSEIPADVHQIYKGIAYNKEEWKAFLKTLPWWQRWF